MHKSVYEKLMSLHEAFSKVSNNHEFKYEWFPVRTPSNNLIEIGGCNPSRGDGVEICVRVIKMNDDLTPVVHENGYTESAFTLTLVNMGSRSFCQIRMGDKIVDVNNIKSRKSFFEILDKPHLHRLEIEFEPVYEKLVVDTN